MIYIYDILLNFSKEIIDFYEWVDEDDIKYIKKIPIYYVESSLIEDLLRYEIKFSKDFLEEIKNKTEVYDDILDNNYYALVCDNRKVLALSMSDDGLVLEISELLIEEEQEVLDIAKRLSVKTIFYDVLDKKRLNISYDTRKEIDIKNRLLSSFKYLYDNNMIDKLNYCYYEYYNNICNDKEYVYKSLVNSFNKGINDKHKYLYEIIKLSSSTS